jgi:RNA polymerase sigma-70 factor (ECF subfamily)
VEKPPMSAPDCTTLDVPFAPANDGALVDDDSTVVSRLRAGEAAAIGELYDRHQSAVHAFGRRLLGDTASAEDLVHDVFVALPKAMGGFRGESSIRTFLISMAVNLARHHVRSATRRRLAMDRFSLETPSAPYERPDQHADRVDLGRELMRALDKLPLDQRVAFVLCEVEERTSRDAAEIVDAPEATVRTRLFLAKKKLREEFERRGLR